jgi:hypothetical protein
VLWGGCPRKYFRPFCFGQGTLLFPWQNAWPNAAAQPRLEAAARNERTLEGVGCSGLIMIEASSSTYLSGMLSLGKVTHKRGEDLMRFYTTQHPFYCGIDLHARSMYVCVLSQDGESLLHRNMKAAPEPFLQTIAPYREGLVVAVECIFTWYWLADLCAEQGIAFVLSIPPRCAPHATCSGDVRI